MLAINDALKASLANYIEANKDIEHSSSDYFKARREISIARFALENQLKVYNNVLEILQLHISSLKELPEDDVQAAAKLQNLTTLFDKIEDKSQSLINSVNTLTRTLKLGMEIEQDRSNLLDSAQVYSILTQIPLILENILLKFLNDPVSVSEIMQEFSNSLENDITVLVNLDRPNNGSVDQSVVEKQVLLMQQSVISGEESHEEK